MIPQDPGFGPLPPLPQGSVRTSASSGKPAWWWLGRYALPGFVILVCISALLLGGAAYAVYQQDETLGATLHIISLGTLAGEIFLLVPCLIVRSHWMATIAAGLVLFISFVLVGLVGEFASSAGATLPDANTMGYRSAPIARAVVLMLVIGATVVAVTDVALRRPEHWAAWLAGILVLSCLLAPVVYLFAIYRRNLYPAGGEVPVLAIATTIVATTLGTILGAVFIWLQ